MVKYLTLLCRDLKDKTIDSAYIDLLNSQTSFAILNVKGETHILTKEGSFFKTDNLKEFINEANNDVYFKTVENEDNSYLEEDLTLYFKYLNKYQKLMTRKYGDKYLFGSIAVKTKNNRIITTIRGKENFDEFTIINNVDYKNNIIYVGGKKATLNSPLLYYLFKNNTNIKAIVHINHQYDDSAPYLPYAFPGTIKDSLRNIDESFNISHHGLFMFFDNKEKMIRSDNNGN